MDSLALLVTLAEFGIAQSMPANALMASTGTELNASAAHMAKIGMGIAVWHAQVAKYGARPRWPASAKQGINGMEPTVSSYAPPGK